MKKYSRKLPLKDWPSIAVFSASKLFITLRATLFFAVGVVYIFGFAAVSAFAGQALPTTAPAPAPLNWQPCADVPARDCATLTVPLDYADISKGMIDLPVARMRATDTANRIGPLVFNLGGPGASSVPAIKSGSITRRFTSEIMSRFDIVGFDVRGTTTGIDCYTNDEDARTYWGANHLPRTYSEISYILGLERAFNQACYDKSRPLIEHVDTASAVRDMEQLRRAMGVEKISYIGFSYGTFLGNRYAHLYPGRLRAMVLDAVVDRSVSDAQYHAENSAAYDDAWRRFKDWCQATITCRLHGENIDATFDNVLAQARANPISAPYNPLGNHPANDWVLTIAVQALVGPGSVTFSWVDEIITKARMGDASLASYIYDNAAGYDPATNTYSSGATRRSITCVDTEWSQKLHTVTDLRTLTLKTKLIAPRFAEADVYQGAAQCIGWKVPPVEPPPVPSTVSGGFPTLVIGATKDASTPLLWAARIAAQTKDGRLLVRDGEGHISITKSRCVMAAVDDALVRLTLTPRGKICPTDADLYPPQPLPELGPASAPEAQHNDSMQRQVTDVLKPQ